MQLERQLSSLMASCSPRASSRPWGVARPQRGRTHRIVTFASSNENGVSTEQKASTTQGKGLPSVACQPCMDGSLTINIDENKIVTKFIAETLLPTRHGKFRVRGYKHSVRATNPRCSWCLVMMEQTRLHHHTTPILQPLCAWSQIDGGKTFTEPTAIMCGRIEGGENVSAAAGATTC